MITWREVPHVHVYVVPIDSIHALDFTNVEQSPDQELAPIRI